MIALISCLSAGSIMLFSLFATGLHDLLHLTYFEINTIASLSALGMYLCNPIIGYFADCYGPASLSLISIWFFCPSYFVNAYLVRLLQNNKAGITSFYVYSFGISFAFIGLATSSLYFSSLLTCAKIYPHHKGLAISLPVTCYGISSLVGSQLMKLDYFNHNNYLDLNRVFTFFAILYLFMGFINFISISIVSIESDIIFEETRLLDDDHHPDYVSTGDYHHHPTVDDNHDVEHNNIIINNDNNNNNDDDDDDDDNNSLIPQRSIIEPLHHNERFKLFLRDPSAWLLLLSLILNIGPLESFQNNLGSILKLLSKNDNLSDQLSISATASTITRLLVGGLSDYLASPERKYPICRIWLLLILITFGIIGQFLINYTSNFAIITAFNGASYGGLFTLYPTIVATIWGVDMMGTTWGAFMVAPAIGSVSYSLLYGQIIDTENLEYIHRFFQLGGFSVLISFVCIVIIWKGIWWKRGFKLF